MKTPIKHLVPSLSMIIGIGAVAVWLGQWLTVPASEIPQDVVSLEPFTTVPLLVLVMGAMCVIAGVVAMARRFPHWWKSAIGMCCGVAPLIAVTSAWIDSIPPSISIDDLEEVRDRALPVIEALTGFEFKEPVGIALGSNTDALAPMEQRVQEDLDKPQYRMPYDLMGLYDRETGVVQIMLDGIWKMQRQGVYKLGYAQEVARATLLHELVHALDYQNGSLKSEAAMLRLMQSDPNRFYVLSAIHEGRATYFARKACDELGITASSDLRTERVSTGEGLSVLQEMALMPVAYVYGNGTRFFQWLGAAGRNDLIDRASSQTPLWQHYITRPDIYANDVDRGMDEHFRTTFAHLTNVLPSPEWKKSDERGQWLLGEVPLWMGDGPEAWDEGPAVELQRLVVGEWFETLKLTSEDDGWVVLRLCRFDDDATAARGFHLGALERHHEVVGRRRENNRKRHGDPGVQNYFASAGSDSRIYCARSGSFILEVKFRGAVSEETATSLADRLIREFLVPLGTYGASSAGPQRIH